MLLVMCAEHIRAHRNRPLVSQGKRRRSGNQKVLPASVPVPAAAETGDPIASKPAPNAARFEITVELDQRLEDISVQYLGGYD